MLTGSAWWHRCSRSRPLWPARRRGRRCGTRCTQRSRRIAGRSCTTRSAAAATATVSPASSRRHPSLAPGSPTTGKGRRSTICSRGCACRCRWTSRDRCRGRRTPTSSRTCCGSTGFQPVRRCSTPRRVRSARLRSGCTGRSEASVLQFLIAEKGHSMRRLRIGVLMLTSITAAAWTIGVEGQAGATRGEWRTYGADLGHTRYAPLDQITAANFSGLEVAWRFKTDNLGPRPEFNLQSTPLMVGGRLYSTGGSRRAVVALDAATGELLWVHSEMEGPRGAAAPRQLSGRGLAYWTDGKEERILYVTPGYRLVALDARTGNLVGGFGRNGIVDLKLEFDQDLDLATAPVGLHATPIVAGNIVLVGAAFETGANPRSRRNVKGAVRAYDARTGKQLWLFRTIPQPGDFGNETWENDSWAFSGNTGGWAQISVDEELGLAYLPVELPTHDYYGGARPGNNLFAESLVAVDLKTGQRRWHYQLVHHGVWDLDIPCAPILADVTINGRTVKVVAQPTKQAFLYVFDRATGQPIWPIEERPVPQGDVPGEKYSPTQPIPTRPRAYDRQGLSVDDLIDFTPELRAEAVKAIAQYRIGPLFTPPVVSRAEGPIATLSMATQGAATNWPGGSYDPETHVLYVYSQAQVATLGLVPPPEGSVDGVRYHQGTVLTGPRSSGGSGSVTGQAGGAA